MATDIRQPAMEVPPLHHGDRLTRAEFERRWEAMPDLKKAELIDGVVHMPALSRFHGTPHFGIIGLLAYYQVHTPGIEGADNTSIRFDDENMPQPDALLRILETHGGRSRSDDEGYYTSGPELIFEIARTTSSYDLGQKRELYRRYEVPEYIVWRVEKPAFDWYVLKDGQYELRKLSSDGILCSQTFPGLWISTNALISGNGLEAIRTLQQGLGSPEHAAFVAELQRHVG